MERQRLKIIDEFRSILDKLRGRNVLVKKDLVKIGNVIEKEGFAPLSELETWRDDLIAWFTSYADCHELHKELFNKSLPDKITTVEAALDTEEKRIQEAIAVGQAEMFLLFFTKDAELANVLREHQKELKKLLTSKRHKSNLRDEVEPYARFVTAMREENKVEKFKLSDGLRSFFSADLIWRGIFDGELTLAILGAEEPDIPKPKKEEITPPPPGDSDFVKMLQSTGALLSDNDFDKWKKFFKVDKVERNKPFSETHFKRDFNSVKELDMLKMVLCYTLSHGLLEIPYFCPEKITSDELLRNVPELLLNKGYIQKYSFAERGSFYGVTRGLYEFAKNADGRKFILPKNFSRASTEKFISFDGNVKSALMRTIYFWLHDIEFKHKNVFCHMHFSERAFLATFDDNGEKDLLIGCFWDRLYECDQFLESIKNLLNKEKKIGRVLIAGLTFEQAKKIFNVLKKVLEDIFPHEADKYLYAFNDNAFSDFYTGEPVTPAEIWGTFLPDGDEPETNPEGSDDEPETNPEDRDDEPEAIPENKHDDIYKPIDILNTFDKSDDALDDNKNFPIEIKSLLLDEKFYCATAYLKALSLNSAEDEPLYRQLAFALNDPLLTETYNAAAILTLIPQDDKPFNETLIIAAALRTFFYNDVEFDYNIIELYDELKKFKLLKENADLSQLIWIVADFKVTNQKGADYFVASVAKNRAATAKFGNVIRDAETYYRQFFEGEFRGETGYTTVKAKQKLFDSNGEFCAAFKLVKAPIEDYSAEALSTVKNFLAENFIRKGAALDSDNLDSDKLLEWVERCWDEVKAKHNKNSLVGDRRNNLISNLERAGEIMCEWVKCAENLSGDYYENLNEKIFAEMAEVTEAAYKKLAKKLKGKTVETAGAIVLAKTLKEISARLNGSYDAAEHKYFYVKFLCDEKIILDEKYLPKLDFNIVDGTGEGIAEQILKHAATKLPSVEKRIEQIFQKHGDDFGSARLLDDYLKATTGESFIAQKKYALEACIAGVGKDIAHQLEEFKGGVEMAQIHGQLSSEADKEKILQIVDNCYAYATASKNYGVFFRVKDFWEKAISKNAATFAKVLEDDLERAIDDFKQNVGNFDTAVLEESVAEIKNILTGGNFAAARTLIAELSRGKLYKKSSTEDVTLSRFIDDYSECYGKVQNISTSLKNLLAKQSSDKNKFYKARGELIDSWLPNGMPAEAGGKEKCRERVGTLLELLGFDVDSINFSDEVDSKSLTFEVKLKKSFQMMHTHPIAAFGSEAEVSKSGFRVTCLFGQFPQENLIDYFKKLDAGNTLVLLDHALKLPERRRLARAIKCDRSLMHIFAVVDRVDIMYMIKNCSEQIKTKRINDTLMSLIMPFSRCQPYIWDPQKLLPPEMFIGRENAMYDVKNPDGVNIVYGGRQLGKSALLKMACREIDGNKNQRAIYVEIRNKDYRAAALFTSRELSDEKFFEEPLETDDWDVLTRAIKKRLSDDTPDKISYFLLMLDEADKFIETCAEVRYAPIDALSRIQQSDYNGSRFKFVIAGLRNIVRFEKERAQSDNPILPVLKSLTIKPFAFEEARKLLEVPLRCLGLRFADDKLIFTIAETALYFPGIIQLFCEKLLLTLFEPNNTAYGENAPPYEITESHIKKVLADEDFLRDIKDKIEITLRLGDDKYYYVIAQILAYLYHENLKVDGYSPADILTCAKSYDLIKPRYLPKDAFKVDALMNELCELNILRKTDSGKYLFARQRIFNYMGSKQKVDDELENLMMEANNG